MDWTSLLFGFRGRINRAKYWLGIVIIMVGDVVLQLSRFAAAGGVAVSLIVNLVVFVVGLALFAIGLSVTIQRLHDRGKSAWWLLLFWLLPGILAMGLAYTVAMSSWPLVGLFGVAVAAISIWAFVELGCLRGTLGPNPYGPDPLGPQAPAA
jgi:uncharacterized membrane protein YhaH (DUF805 family)